MNICSEPEITPNFAPSCDENSTFSLMKVHLCKVIHYVFPFFSRTTFLLLVRELPSIPISYVLCHGDTRKTDSHRYGPCNTINSALACSPMYYHSTSDIGNRRSVSRTGRYTCERKLTCVVRKGSNCAIPTILDLHFFSFYDGCVEFHACLKID